MTSSACNSSVQDLELVSALMSMRTSGNTLQPSHHLANIREKHIESPDSPTRIEEECIISPFHAQGPSPPRRPWHEQPIAPIYPHMRSHHYLANHIPAHGHSMHPSIPPFSVVHYQGHHSSIKTQPQGAPVIRYTAEQRKAAVLRYKEKKMRRKNQSSVIRYEVRKRLADTRPRFRGRFFKPNSRKE